MLRVGLFNDFKGADTILVWGDAEGFQELHSTVLALLDGQEQTATVGSGRTTLTIDVEDSGGFGLSRLISDPIDANSLRWTCSQSLLDNTAGLLAGLATATNGHQYVDVSGPVATQLMFSAGEYPDEMSPSL
jgi:hypothetical protein